MKDPMTINQLIARLQELVKVKGDFGCTGSEPVKFNFEGEDYYITNAMISVPQDYNFDEANCGPYTEIKLFYV